MELGRAQVHLSASTWRQPLPPAASPERAALIEHVAKRILATSDGRLRVGIDGLTASGKTSFGHELAERISCAGRPVLRASLDDFKKPWRDRHLYDRESGEGTTETHSTMRSLQRFCSSRPALPDPGTASCAASTLSPRWITLPSSRARQPMQF
jgi:uridine kinase